MKRKFEKLVSLILAMAMCLSMIQTTAFAAEVEADAAASIAAQEYTWDVQNAKVSFDADTGSASGQTTEVVVSVSVTNSDGKTELLPKTKLSATQLKTDVPADAQGHSTIYAVSGDSVVRYDVVIATSGGKCAGEDTTSTVTVTASDLAGVNKSTPISETYVVTKAAGSHNFKTDAGSMPGTCSKGGTGTKTCQDCGYSVVMPDTQNADLHKLVWTPAKAATPTAQGNVDYYTCSDCKKVFVYKNGSDYVVADKSDITNYNNVDYYDTTNATEIAYKNNITDKGGVMLDYDNQVTWSYFTGIDGFKNGELQLNSDWDERLVKTTYTLEGAKVYTVLAGNSIAYQEPTCSTKGTLGRYWKGNDGKLTFGTSEELATVDHKLESVKTKVEATCLTNRVITGTCSWCDKTVDVELENTMLQHKLVEKSGTVNVTGYTNEQKKALASFQQQALYKVKDDTYLLKDGSTLTVNGSANTASGILASARTVDYIYVYDNNYCEDQEYLKAYGFCTAEKKVVLYELKLEPTKAEKAALGVKDADIDGPSLKLITHKNLLEENLTKNVGVTTKESTCDTKGTADVTKLCPYCDKELAKETATLPAKGHSPTDKLTVVWGTAAPDAEISNTETDPLAQRRVYHFTIAPVCSVCSKPCLGVYEVNKDGSDVVLQKDEKGNTLYSKAIGPWVYARLIEPESLLTSESDDWYNYHYDIYGWTVKWTENKILATDKDSAVYQATVTSLTDENGNAVPFTTAGVADGSVGAQKSVPYGSFNIHDEPRQEARPSDTDTKPEDTKGETEKLAIKQEKRPVYNGKQQNVPFKVFAGDKELVEGKDYTVSTVNGGSKFTSAGKHKVTVTGIGDYAGMTVSGYVYIDPASIAKAVVTQTKTVYYNGSLQNTPVKVTLNGKTLKAGTDYTIVNASSGATGAQFTGVGTHKIYVKGIGNYKGSVTFRTVIVAGKQSAVKVTPASKTLKVNKKKAQTVTLKVTGVKDKAKVTYKSSNSKVKVSAKGVVTVPKSFKGTAKITVKVAATAKYAATSKTVTITVK